ncbi:MAG TPA: glycosyltransferase family 4 protein [Chthoniobacteraceae bacterium]|nr:glycosyltransferase family 4 protein [Chthoniobacteraceae bacterium]
MKIAFVTQNINRGDGQGRVCYELAKRAVREGHEVWLLTNFAEPDLIEAGAKWIPLHPHRWGASLLTVWHFASLADRALDRMGSEMDVIHGFGYSLSRPHHLNSAQFVHRAWSRSPAQPIRSSWSVHAIYHWLYTRFNIGWEQLAFGRAGLIVACSRMVKDELVASGIPETKIRVIGNGVDMAEFSADRPERRSLGLPEGVPLFVFAGDIRTPRKNLGAVLTAMVQIPEAHLAVVGALPRSPFPRMAARLGIASRVHFLGFREDLPAVMTAADAFVFPSQYEPFGMVVLEAMASGLPVIVAATVGAACLVSPQSGIVIENPQDLAALVHAKRQLTADPQMRKEMGAAGQRTARDHSWEKVTQAYMDIYAELAFGKERVSA